MNVAQAVVLGVVEGLTEFLPVSSTGHLTIGEGLLGLKADDRAVTAFTAVVQSGAILAVLVYFRTDLRRLVGAVLRGLFSAEARRDPEWRFAWYVMAGSVPIGVVGLAARRLVEGPLRALWVVGIGLVVWSAVMVFAERRGRQSRDERHLSLTDSLVVGLVQCAALVPGVSRSGATISAGLLRGLDRTSATRLSFFLAIPALTAAGVLELPGALSAGVGAAPTLIGAVVAFAVAYVSIGWLLRFVSGHSVAAFVPYRVFVGVTILLALVVLARYG